MSEKKINPKQQAFFDQKAGVWDQVTVHDLDKVRYITGLLDIRGDERIMDIGTGTGIMIPFYQERLTDGSVLAVDYSEKMIEVARSKYPEDGRGLSYLVSDLYDLRFDDKFDLVVCYSCFPHFVDQPLAIEILARALKKGGRLVIAHSDSAKKINGVHMSGGMEIENDFLPSMKRLQEMMVSSGLAIQLERDDDRYFICMASKI